MMLRPAVALPSHVAEFRARYRASEIGPHYTGWGHLALTSGVALLAIAFSLWHLRCVSPAQWLWAPVFFLFANLCEYLGHRGPMHHPRRGLTLLYQRHTRQHHHFFTHAAMPAESSRDFKMVLFPPILLLFFLGCIAAPLGALLFQIASANVAWIFVATVTAYFLSYEWLHLCYHLPADSLAGRLPLMAALRRHHTSHHDLALMGRWNFNITFPISDLLLGTLYREDPEDRPQNPKSFL